jgi:hypothetical protein
VSTRPSVQLEPAIPEVVEETMSAYSGPVPGSLNEALEVLEWSRMRCALICDKKTRNIE